jgi:TolB-like protein/class 3 adenylate cyclase/Tfp pilus assembly protein PilF
MLSPESASDVKFEIGHVLFIDIVGYSKLLITEQSDQLQLLKEIVRGTEQVRIAEAEGKLLRLPTGDGGALVFRTSPEAPVLCAIEISKGLKRHPELRVRMGIHSGPVNEITDLNEQANIAGAGINIAQRVMDCGDAGHILLSRHVAEDLEHYPRWQPFLHDLGEYEVKHGHKISVVNLYTDGLGNRKKPEKFRKTPVTSARRANPLLLGTVVILSLVALAIVAIIFAPAILRSREKAQRKNVVPANETSAAVIPEKSIAVLPFENLSSDKENAFFAEGIQDEILTRLAKIAALKVISRTSTQKYKSAPDNLREIGKQLGVANLLEGSVQRISDAAHVNVQLIRVSTDEHLWAESYNRKLDDVFAVEGEVAAAIADQLNAKLTGSEKDSLTTKLTSNPQAYDAYLRGLAFQGRIEAFESSISKSIEAFEEAVRLDPQFGVAWAQLVREYALAYINFKHTSQLKQAARQALENAVKLAPNLAETQLAEGVYQHYFEGDYEAAKTRYQAVRRQFPNNSAAVEFLGGVARRQNHWDQSHQFYKEAIELDPQNVFLLADASLTDAGMRDVTSARRLLERARNLSPENPTVIGILASTYQESGEIAQAQTLLDTVTPVNGNDWYFQTLANNASYSRNYERALTMVSTQVSKTDALGSSLGSFQSTLADLQRHAGNTDAASKSYEQARQTLEAALREQTDSATLISNLAWAEAWLGNKNKALDLARKAIALDPASKDAYTGPLREEALARIQAHFGDKENAIPALQHLLSIAYGPPPLTPALLRLDPDWDNLRGDPRFEKLCQEPNK